jgi:GDPmannose 4,6-dehydratase
LLGDLTSAALSGDPGLYDLRAHVELRSTAPSDRYGGVQSPRRALITGIAGQDGSFLTEHLLEHGYEVYGTVRRDPTEQYENLRAVRERVELIQANLLDEHSLVKALETCSPHEVYNLASVSFVPASWEEPVLTAQFAAVGVTSMLEAIRHVDPRIRFYQASSSEIFGEPTEAPQNESTPLAPVTPYGVAKAYGHFIVGSFRRRYGLFACSGILYNHESWRRPVEFVPRKISRAAAAISLGLETELALGDLDATRDWGFAGDYVRAMRLMLAQSEPEDYVIASGHAHRVRDLAQWAFAHVGLDWHDHVRVNESLKRGRAELHRLVGDAARAHSILGWRPSLTVAELMRLMVEHDLSSLERLSLAEHRSRLADDESEVPRP